jgi:membrane protein implicated in regulation of membrane protease activity
MGYNFDDRLLWESVTLTSENFQHDLIRLNGIYYFYQSPIPLSIGDRVIVTGIKGNVLFLEKEIKGD